MARRSSSKLWNLGILVLVGGGIYWAWRSGALTQLSQAISQAMGGGGVPAKSDIDQLVDEEMQKINDAIAKAQQAQAAQIADILDKAQKFIGNKVQENGANAAAHLFDEASGKADTSKVADEASRAAKLAWAAIGASIPIWLGTTKQASEFTHQANVAITHAIGQKTGREKGIVTLFTSRGPFLVNKTTHLCYNMAGREIPCPAPEEVRGIATADYEAMIDAVTAS